MLQSLKQSAIFKNQDSKLNKYILGYIMFRAVMNAARKQKTSNKYYVFLIYSFNC